MPSPGSHNYRQLGVLGMGHKVRNPCLGSPGSQMGPPSYKISLYIKAIGILLSNRNVMGLPGKKKH